MTTSDNRLLLHAELVRILGSNNVYFQPPESVKIKYPAIIYSRNSINNRSASNKIYIQDHSYMVTYIDKDPESDVVDALSTYPMSSFDRHYVADGLNHDVFTIYYK